MELNIGCHHQFYRTLKKKTTAAFDGGKRKEEDIVWFLYTRSIRITLFMKRIDRLLMNIMCLGDFE